MSHKLRFSFDMGTNSLGWAVLKFDDVDNLLDIGGSGARIYSDGRNPKDGSSLAEMRRGPRGARRRRDRFLQRQRLLSHKLIAHGLFPVDAIAKKSLATDDPYALRLKALDEKLDPFEIGRAFWHLNRRRGFKSNRKTDGADKDSGKVKAATKRLGEAIERESARTIGEFLAKRKFQGTRFRVSEDEKIRFDFFPTREMVKNEFDLIWRKQKVYHPDLLSDSAYDAIEKAIFDQRPLKKQPVGKCTFNPNEERMRLGLPSVEARRIYEKLNSIRYGKGFDVKTILPKIFRDAFATVLLNGGDITFKKMRSELKLSPDQTMNFEASEERLVGCSTSKKLAAKGIFGNRWSGFSWQEKDAIATKFYDEEDEAVIAAWLIAHYGIDPEAAEKISGWTPKDSHASLGPSANAAILDELIAEVIVYSDACKNAGFHHSDFRDGEIWPKLPFYGELLQSNVIEPPQDVKDRAKKFRGSGREESTFGKIPNPTVHIGLNQLRRVANKLIEEFGAPDEIVLELARDLKQSKKEKDESSKRNKVNRDKNDKRRESLEKIGIPVNHDSMLRVRLWEDQMVDGVVLSPYSLKTISFSQIFTAAIEIDHVLPVSRTLDDTPANKVLCFAGENRRKRNKSPHEAFANDDNWPQVEANALSLPRNKAWRFGADAMKPKKDGQDFLARQLNDTRHLAKIAKAYLGALTGGKDVWVVTGQLTAMERGKWGLNDILSDHNRKNRNDHRHHAIDAIVIGCTSRSMVMKMAKCASNAEGMDLDKVFAEFPEPMGDKEKFRNAVRESVSKIIVSHKVEHGKQGALHEDTAYGIKVSEEEKAVGNVVRRVNLDAIQPKMIRLIRDKSLHDIFHDIARETAAEVDDNFDIPTKDKEKAKEKAFTKGLLDWAKKDAEEKSVIAISRGHPPRQPMRHLRLLKQEGTLVEIANRQTGEPYKGVVPAENWCVDIVSVPDKKKGGYVWKGFGAHIFEVNKKNWRPIWEREKVGGKLIMRLHKGDLVELLDDDGIRRVKRVVRLVISSSQIYLVPHNESGNYQERHVDKEDGFLWDFAGIPKLKDREARKVSVDEIGRLKYK